MTWLRFLVATAIILPALMWTMPHPWFVTAIIAALGLAAGHVAQRTAQKAEGPRRKPVFGVIAAVVIVGFAAGIAGALLRGEAINEADPPARVSPPAASSVERPIEVVLSADGAVTVAGRSCALEDVPGRLGALDIDRGVLIITAQNVERDALQALMEQLTEAGVEKFSLKTEN